MPALDPFDATGFGPGDVQTSSTIGVASAMPAVRSIDIKGGAVQVADLAGRDAIPGALLGGADPAQFRQEGMTCYVASNQRTYRLIGGIANPNWVDVTSATSVAPKTRNTDVDAVLIGHILCQSPAIAGRVRLGDVSADDARSRPVGVATSAQPAPGGAALLQTNQGETVPVRLVAGLALGAALGEEIIMSSVNGDGTLPGGASAPVAGQLVQRVGILIDPLGYNGAADRLVLIQFDLAGARRIES